MITTVMEVTEVGIDDAGPFVIGAGSLWCDGLRIYEVSNMGMRIVSGAPVDAVGVAASTTAHSTIGTGPFKLPITVDVATYPQLIDHAVNGVPVVPVVFVVEWFARLAAAHCPDLFLARLTDLRVLNGLVAERYFQGGSLDLIAEVVSAEQNNEGVLLTLHLINPTTGRAHYRCAAQMCSTTPPFDGPLEPNDGASAGSEPWTAETYFGDVLFHGPAFRVIEEITGVSERGIDACCWGVLAVGWRAEAWASDPALLDGALQLALLWTERQLGLASLPTAIGSIRLFSEPTPGQHVVTLIGRQTTAHKVVCDVQIRSAAGDVVALLEGIETHVLGQPNSA
jgi:hypothetical protein